MNKNMNLRKAIISQVGLHNPVYANQGGNEFESHHASAHVVVFMFYTFFC